MPAVARMRTALALIDWCKSKPKRTLVKKRDSHAPVMPEQSDDRTAQPANARNEAHLVVPVVEEELNLEKRKVVTGKVRITTDSHEEEALVDEPLTAERVKIERVPANRPINSAPQPRQEGDTLIIPVVEEVLVKRLMLKEEVRVRRVSEVRHSPQRVKLRREEVRIDRGRKRSATRSNLPMSAWKKAASRTSRNARGVFHTRLLNGLRSD